jgi:hypothetical protein
MPAAVLYTLPVEPAQAEDGPEIVGTGRAFTVTLLTVGDEAVQPLPFV